jgi:hypothetical protein
MANWQDDELLLTLHLYCRTPFGKLHNRNPDVIQLANAIGRTASAVALKATNLASLDQSIPQTGMSNTSKADRALWNVLIKNFTDIANYVYVLCETKVLSFNFLLALLSEIKISKKPKYSGEKSPP